MAMVKDSRHLIIPKDVSLSDRHNFLLHRTNVEGKLCQVLFNIIIANL